MSTKNWREAERAAFGPKKARRYWQGAFPDLMEFRLSKGDVEVHSILEREIAPHAFFRIERASSAAAHRRLDAIADSIIGKEKWNHGLESFDRGGYFGFLWPSGDVAALPSGVFTFSIDTEDEDWCEASPKHVKCAAPINIIGFKFHLAFVRKALRARGYGAYIGSAVARWLYECKVTPPRCPKKGVPVYYFADFHSKGGEAVSRIVTSEFRLFHGRFQCGEVELSWYIKHFEADVGY